MRTLKEDKEEFDDTPAGKTLRRWCARKRREAGILPDEPVTWFLYAEDAKESHMLGLGRSPGDVILTGEVMAQAGMWYSLGSGRWMMENNGGDEDASNVYAVVRPSYDPEGYQDEEGHDGE